MKEGSTTIKSYSYDAQGRTTSVVSAAGTTSMSYDYEDRLTSITLPSGRTDTYTYNGEDTRTGMNSSAGSQTFKRAGAGVTAPVLSDGLASYTPGVSRHTSSGSTFYGTDRQGTDSLQTSATGTVSATKVYDGFGMLVSTTGTPVGPFGYNGASGYQEDADTGLMLLGHRYYDSSTGRFITRDPVKDGSNWYDYVSNNPAKSSDPEGYFPFGISFGCLISGGKIIISPTLHLGKGTNIPLPGVDLSPPTKTKGTGTIPKGDGWVDDGKGNVVPIDPKGGPVHVQPGGGFQAPRGWTIVRNSDGFYDLSPPAGQKK